MLCIPLHLYAELRHDFQEQTGLVNIKLPKAAIDKEDNKEQGSWDTVGEAVASELIWIHNSLWLQ